MDIPLPQSSADSRDVARGFDENGNLVFRQVGFQELEFGAVFGGKTISTSQNDISLGIKTFTIDTNDEKINVGYVVEIVSLDDQACFMYGLVTRKDTTSEPWEVDVAINTISQITGTFSVWEIQVISGPALGIESDTTAISSTSITIGTGSKTFTIQADKFLPESASVLVSDINTPGNKMYGTVVSYSGTSIQINVLNAFGAGTAAAWAIRLLDGPGASTAGSAEDYGLLTVAASDFNDWGSLT